MITARRGNLSEKERQHGDEKVREAAEKGKEDRSNEDVEHQEVSLGLRACGAGFKIGVAPVTQGLCFAGSPFCFRTPMTLASAKRLQLNPRYTNWRLRVGRSPIHRLGVFAAEDIPSGRKVIEYAGERITYREANKRFVKIWRSSKSKPLCLFHLNRRWVIDGAVGGSGAELINHACEPNLRTRRIRGHILYFSCRRIRRGEELAVDYRFSKKAVRVPCRCGSPRCRGTINLK
jgi:uncharacterized protein